MASDLLKVPDFYQSVLKIKDVEVFTLHTVMRVLFAPSFHPFALSFIEVERDGAGNMMMTFTKGVRRTAEKVSVALVCAEDAASLSALLAEPWPETPNNWMVMDGMPTLLLLRKPDDTVLMRKFNGSVQDAQGSALVDYLHAIALKEFTDAASQQVLQTVARYLG